VNLGKEGAYEAAKGALILLVEVGVDSREYVEEAQELRVGSVWP
jgi:hypothetical protein